MSLLESEIAEIPSRLRTIAAANRAPLDAAIARFRAAPPPALFTIARGSSDAAAAYAAYRLTPALGIPVGSFAPSLASLDRVVAKACGLWTLAISQSGRSPDLLAAQAAFANSRGVRLALVNDLASPLAAGADIVLDQSAGEEHSVAATKSVCCSLLAIDLLAEALAGRGSDNEARGAVAADAAEQALATPHDLSALDAIDSAYVIGRGASLPVALEAALKLKEVAGLHAEAISAAEVMHGPRALAGKRLAILGFAGPGAAGASVVEALRAMAAQGSRVTLAAAPDREAVAAIALLAGFYAALPALARRRGRDPDHPAALGKVTLTL
jgi:glucosamine--fructose-6-phosphate aminotransferase (isomerizing)